MARILLDTCVPLALKLSLSADGHDVQHCLDWGSDPGDPRVLERAIAETRILISYDKGFTDRLRPLANRHFGIIRLNEIGFDYAARIVPPLIARYEGLLAHSGVIIVNSGGFRVFDIHKNRTNGFPNEG